MPISRFSVWTIVTRTTFVVLFAGICLVVWRPVHEWAATHVVAPVLAQVDTPRAQQYRVVSEGRDVAVYQSSNRIALMDLPTGGIFVFAGMFLIAVRPYRPLWLYVALYQWGLGIFMLGGLIAGIGWSDWGFSVFHLLDGEFYQGTSFGLALLLWQMCSRSDRSTVKDTSSAQSWDSS